MSHILGLKIFLRNWCGSGWLLLLLRVGRIRPPHSNNRSNNCCPATCCYCGYKKKWMVLSAHLPAMYAHSSQLQVAYLGGRLMYVILHMKIRQREVNILQFGSGKWFFMWIFVQFGEAGTRFLVCDPAH
jgi:hypothetical protein